MAQARRPLIVLLHAAGPGPYVEMVKRARLLQLGAEHAYPWLRFDRVLGRTPDDDPVTGTGPTLPRLLEYARRMIQGDGASALDSAAAMRQPGAAQAWIVGWRTDDVEQQVAFAVEVGLVVEQIPGDLAARRTDGQARPAGQGARTQVPTHGVVGQRG